VLVAPNPGPEVLGAESALQGRMLASVQRVKEELSFKIPEKITIKKEKKKRKKKDDTKMKHPQIINLSEKWSKCHSSHVFWPVSLVPR
jgi:hypothetical protein